MKKVVQYALLMFVVAMILLNGCAPAPKTVPTSTPIPSTLTPSPIPATFTPSHLPPTSTPEITATSVSAPNPFVGYWTQTKLSEHPLGMSVCGNFQNVEFFEDGTFTITNDYSGVYKAFDFGGFGGSSSSGKYTILSENQIEIKYSEDNVTVWEYVFSGDELTMSSPAPSEFGDGFIPCYFSKSSK